MSSQACEAFKIPPIVRGHFDWNEQSNELEFVRTSPGKAHHMLLEAMHGGSGGQTADKSRTFASSNAMGYYQRDSPLGVSRFTDPTSNVVSLGDVKQVAVSVLTDDRTRCGEIVSPLFHRLFHTAHFDSFLVTALRYFRCFFAGIQQQNHPNKTKYLHPSKAELEAAANTQRQLVIAKKRVGQTYCALILGIGLKNTHHMGCGSQRVSSSHRDMRLFEDLYAFCAVFVWIAFRRQEYQRVCVEIGDMLRSKPFNPAYQKPSKQPLFVQIRKSSVPRKGETAPATEMDAGEGTANCRPKSMKRPAIMTVIHQRSMALAALLPLPKEKSDYLFRPLTSCGKIPSLLLDSRKKELSNLDQSLLQLQTMRYGEVIGIIGEPYENFNALDLTPKEPDDDDGSNNDADDSGMAANRSAERSPVTNHQPSNAQSRLTTAADN